MRREWRSEICGLKKKLLAGFLGLAVCFSLGACAKGDKIESTEIARTDEIADTVETPKAEEISGTVAVQDQIVEGVQLADGYGIFKAGQAPVYILKEEPKVIETEGAKAWLLSSVYQDGLFRFLVKVEDHSITLIPQKEVEELLKQQEDDPVLQEKTDRQLLHLDYFPIDPDNKVYGRSEFEIKAGYRTSEEGVLNEFQKDHFTNTITGAGIPGGSFSAERTGCIRQYQEYLSRGYVTSYFWYYTDQMKLDIPGPEGSYRIDIPGFTDGFTAEFKKARQYPSVKDIPGMIFKDGVGMLAEGELTGNNLTVNTFVWSDGTYGLTPEVSGLACELEGNTEHAVRTRFQSNQNNYGSTREFYSLMEGTAWKSFSYEIPEGFEKGEFFLECSKVNLSATKDQSQWLQIPIPDEKTELDLSAELSDCTIHILSAEIRDEPWGGTAESGSDDDRRPYVYLETKVDLKGDKFLRMESVLANQVEDDPQDLTPRRWFGSYMSNGLTGLRAYYEDGDEELPLRFEKPYYSWYEKFRLPVQIKES